MTLEDHPIENVIIKVISNITQLPPLPRLQNSANLAETHCITSMFIDIQCYLFRCDEKIV